MKYLFLILISFNSYAGFIAGGKINDCARTDYSEKTVCEKTEKQECYLNPDNSGFCGVLKFDRSYQKGKKRTVKILVVDKVKLKEAKEKQVQPATETPAETQAPAAE